jgi:hypothetical protein
MQDYTIDKTKEMTKCLHWGGIRNACALGNNLPLDDHYIELIIFNKNGNQELQKIKPNHLLQTNYSKS